jgi:hypothetical protein
MYADSVGIETVADHDGTSWEVPTAEQVASIKAVVKILQDEYGVTDADIHEHDKIRTRRQVKVRACTTLPLLSSLLLSCSHAIPARELDVNVIKVEPARYTGEASAPLRDSCRAWSLTPRKWSGCSS